MHNLKKKIIFTDTFILNSRATERVRVLTLWACYNFVNFVSREPLIVLESELESMAGMCFIVLQRKLWV